MHARDLFPVLDACEQDARSHHVRERCARVFERLSDDLETASGLRRRVAGRDRAPIRAERRGARDGDEPPARTAREMPISGS